MPLKVRQHGAGVVAKITEVYGFSARAQKQQSVKDLEKLARWLMNGAQDGLARFVCQLAKESNDSPSALRVESRRGLIQEE